MDDKSTSFQLLMARLENQDESLKRIETKLDGINGRVRQSEKDIIFAKGLGYMAMTLAAAFWAVWGWLTGGK